MTELNKRHSEILDILSRRGYAAIEEMVAAFNVTPQTLRRDLQELSDRGLLRRHHGGASANLSTANADYELRHVETAAEKAAIARAAAELVTPGSSLFLTPGTTVDALAKAIAERRPRGLRVVTNSTAAASILDRCPEISILITGGFWLGQNRALGGMHAAAFIENYRCDLHMTSIGGIDADGNLLEYRDDEAVVGRAMMRNARRSVLLADHTKFSRVAMSRVAHLREMSTLVTDRKPGPTTLQMIKDARCELIVAG
ncbi:DeoR/GlpR family DNA-binding transcription regulator [Bosea sp. (in: a-proteobacteria)]|jgi:DeoR family glycerol-3-phosphate regulon repressor|uniref:DeoR/GlpR family DNA-binding transcription regulator n=1 Tax=Bosea sp. (in: a-proteobacteria) TaxID=1871050 RepID=UPI003F712517